MSAGALELWSPNTDNVEAAKSLLFELRSGAFEAHNLPEHEDLGLDDLSVSSEASLSDIIRGKIDWILEGDLELGELLITEARIVEAISAEISKNDAPLAAHQGRVAGIAGNIVRQAGGSEKEIEETENGAVLHDLGKLYVPKHIRNKEGRFTKEEYRAMQEHPGLGADKLDPVICGIILKIVRGHHENLDGSGYPEGLRGKEISFGAMATSIADRYDAMTNRKHNVGREKSGRLTHAAAVQEIVSRSGSHFDPELVRAFQFVAARMAPLQLF